jgi:hypothetical protein
MQKASEYDLSNEHPTKYKDPKLQSNKDQTTRSKASKSMKPPEYKV